VPANIVDKYREVESLTGAKRGATMNEPGPTTKRLRVDSPNPSEGDCEDRNMLEQKVNQPQSEIAVVRQPTEVVMHPEPVETGDAEDHVPMLQMAANVTEETESISTQESLIREAWHGWEDSLRMAHRMRRVGAAALRDESTLEPSLRVRKLTREEQENLEKWKVHFLGQPEGFEEDEMEVDAFGMDELA